MKCINLEPKYLHMPCSTLSHKYFHMHAHTPPLYGDQLPAGLSTYNVTKEARQGGPHIYNVTKRHTMSRGTPAVTDQACRN
jgi:hypothetical protein